MSTDEKKTRDTAITPASNGQPYLIEARGICQSFGVTRALSEVDLAIQHGSVLGLVGANGAGKSTLVRVLAGVIQPDDGELSISSESIDLDIYAPEKARKHGVRVVYQELSLCTNLSVYENFFLEQSSQFKGRKWREAAITATKRAMDSVFPHSGIHPRSKVHDLSISQRQMVEIARAISDPDMKLLILDEPTSSLGAEQTTQLLEFISKGRSNGRSFIFISHRLREILSVADQIVVMVNGQVRWLGAPSDTSEASLIKYMGNDQVAMEGKNGRPYLEPGSVHTMKARNVLVSMENLNNDKLHGITTQLFSGEVIGIAGLEGSGQREFLYAIYNARRYRSITIHGKVAFVSGDRGKEGVFPYWSIAKNLSLTNWVANIKGVLTKTSLEREWTNNWIERLKIKTTHVNAPLVGLSGGNQQKVLIARALQADTEIILFDDPTRGVDVETKQQLYELFKDIAHAHGKLVVWLNSEDEELQECDRVLVMKNGQIVRELEHSEISKDAIISSSFQTIANRNNADGKTERRRGVLNWVSRSLSQRVSLPIVALLIVLAGLTLTRPSSVSEFGLELLIGAALPMVFAAISQMFVIVGSDIDLGIGAFLGLTNVLSATVLVKHFWLGVLLLIFSIIIYGGMGLFIHMTKIPAIVATLGASFVWLGIALTILNSPGGSSPIWLSNFVNLPIPIVPEAVIIVAVFGYLSYVILMRSKYGIVLRGFGNNPQSIELSGWSALRARTTLYLLAGVFGVLGGLSITATSTAADATATSSYTLLSVAAVVLGGGDLFGGIVSSFGAALGAVSLALLGALLGFLSLGSSYDPGVQGLLLFVIIGIRVLRRREA